MHYLAFHNVVPSFVLVVVVWYAIRVDVRRALLYGLVAGICEDALAAQTGAAWTISTTASSVIASVLSRGFFADSIPLVTGVTAVATLSRALLFWIVMSLEGYPPGLGAMHFRQSLIEVPLNVAIIIVAMVVARHFEAAER